MRSQAPSEWEACGGLNIHAHSLSCKDLCSKGLYTNWLTICILFTALTKLVPLSKRHCRTGPCIGRKRLNALMIQKVFNSSTSSIGYTLIPSKQNCAYRACGQSTWRAPCRHTQRSKGFNANKCKRDLVSKRYLRILLAEGSSQFLKRDIMMNLGGYQTLDSCCDLQTKYLEYILEILTSSRWWTEKPNPTIKIGWSHQKDCPSRFHWRFVAYARIISSLAQLLEMRIQGGGGQISCWL